MNPTCTFPERVQSSAVECRPEAEDRLRRAAYVAVAVAAFVTGLLMGLVCAGDPFGSRAPASPNSLLPHPRAIQG